MTEPTEFEHPDLLLNPEPVEAAEPERQSTIPPEPAPPLSMTRCPECPASFVQSDPESRAYLGEALDHSILEGHSINFEVTTVDD